MADRLHTGDWSSQSTYEDNGFSLSGHYDYRKEKKNDPCGTELKLETSVWTDFQYI